jgi:RNA polymerase sigma-70 factor (ECF subfamily)
VEASAFEAIVRRHYGGLVRLAEQRCGGGALVEDAVQTGLIRAHAYLRRNGEVSNLSAWLRRVVYNCATDLLERERKSRPEFDRIAEPAAAESDRLERHELRALVAAAISRLGEPYREPLRMHYLDGLESKEIAIRLHDNLNSIKSRIARGRRELRRRLEGVLSREGYL